MSAIKKNLSKILRKIACLIGGHEWNLQQWHTARKHNRKYWQIKKCKYCGKEKRETWSKKNKTKQHF